MAACSSEFELVPFQEPTFSFGPGSLKQPCGQTGRVKWDSQSSCVLRFLRGFLRRFFAASVQVAIGVGDLGLAYQAFKSLGLLLVGQLDSIIPLLFVPFLTETCRGATVVGIFGAHHTAPQRAASAKWRACSSDAGAIRKDRHQRGSKPRRELQQHRSPRAAQGATTLFIRCQGACSTIKGYNKRNSKMQVLWAPFHRRLTLLTFYFLPFWVQMHLQTNADPPKTRIRPNPPSPIRFARMLPNLLGLSAVGRSSVAYTLQRF